MFVCMTCVTMTLTYPTGLAKLYLYFLCEECMFVLKKRRLSVCLSNIYVAPTSLTIHGHVNLL